MKDRLLIIKVGTGVLLHECANKNVRLNVNTFKRIAQDIVELKRRGYKIIVVCSGAIAAGKIETGLNSYSNSDLAMPELQRLASIGWRHILNEWSNALVGQTIAELLITQHELRRPAECSEMIGVLRQLMYYGDIPFINENDSISHEEISFGDNDILAAQLASTLKATGLFKKGLSLIILSTVDGVYFNAQHPTSVHRVISNIELARRSIGSQKSSHGTGGMTSKFAAATIATDAGIPVYICNGTKERAIQRALSGKTGTQFSV